MGPPWCGAEGTMRRRECPSGGGVGADVGALRDGLRLHPRRRAVLADRAMSTERLYLALLIWVARDSKARGMENPILWVLLVLLLSVIGVVIYLINRPKAELRDCPSCGKKRMEGLLRCPHCGNP